MLTLDDASQNIDIGDFSELERLAGGTLPNAFKVLYLRHNGGFPPSGDFDGDEYVFSINGFNPVKYGRPSIEQLLMRLGEEYSLLKGLVPFAYDDGGNTFMLSVRDADCGVVYLWIQGESRLEKVISSFEEFLSAVESGAEE
ncbi:SMI1/KNR4 family protein [Pseudomonas eucalypticola]|uniref:SMI1/KNR4 family protein n=1 Tax=Pseudomonas eucalypticola TaxID=2599595 RepID=A0A7D5GZJ5_9PSED|nr:SMI1/KNR4 family protein [Pseudomonas eucalypticola]QKZ03785.1 SMI1/KNR4 family protein [Pseudomonas eucalypticola]